ncbi:MAG: DUF3149 domain-containing protein [Methylotenera sp.]|nr:DUF3149 domain-containing protein [Methylotenera sp.]NOT65110.1 DUF3149 domain-containing protein [Methylotenera sp.]
MKLLTDLLSTGYGLLSVATIAFVLGMCVFFYFYIKRMVEKDTKNAKK